MQRDIIYLHGASKPASAQPKASAKLLQEGAAPLICGRQTRMRCGDNREGKLSYVLVCGCGRNNVDDHDERSRLHSNGCIYKCIGCCGQTSSNELAKWLGHLQNHSYCKLVCAKLAGMPVTSHAASEASTEGEHSQRCITSHRKCDTKQHYRFEQLELAVCEKNDSI
jgi:hypothetical protein